LKLVPFRSYLLAAPLTAISAASNANAGVCAVAAKPLGLLPFIVSQVPDEKHITEIRADFDRDGREDLLQWSPQESASLIPADYASVTLKLASSEQRFVLEEAYVNVLMYNRRYYVVAASIEQEAAPSKAVVFAIGRTGFRRLCSFTSRSIQRR